MSNLSELFSSQPDFLNISGIVLIQDFVSRDFIPCHTFYGRTSHPYWLIFLSPLGALLFTTFLPNAAGICFRFIENLWFCFLFKIFYATDGTDEAERLKNFAEVLKKRRKDPRRSETSCVERKSYLPVEGYKPKAHKNGINQIGSYPASWIFQCCTGIDRRNMQSRTLLYESILLRQFYKAR